MPSVQLNTLTDDEKIKSLCSSYWATNEENQFVHTVSKLATEYGMKSSDISKVALSNCQAYSDDYHCKRCQQPFVYSNRSDFLSKMRSVRNDLLCSRCNAEEAEARRQQKLAEIEGQRQAIQSHYALSQNPPLNIAEMSFENAVYLLSFVRVNASEDLSFYASLDDSKEHLSPSMNFSTEMLRQLFRSSYITVHPNSPIGAFDFQEGEPNRFYVNKVLWRLRFGNDVQEAQNSVVELERVFRTQEWPEHWRNEKQALWKKLVLQECLAYLNVVLGDHNLTLNAGEKTYLVFSNVLENYSAGQVYNMIWRAGKDAAAFYMRGGVSKPHAANTVIGAIQKYADKAKAEGWPVKAYRRDWRCPEPMVSQVLFNTVLQIGDNGLNLPPIASSLNE